MELFLKFVVLREMQWSEELQFNLIREVRGGLVIWDPKNELKREKNKKVDAFIEIAACPKFMGLTFDKLKKKFRSLSRSYRSYCRKAMRKPSGTGTSAIYKLTWVFFGEMGTFLRDVYASRGATDVVSNLMLWSFILYQKVKRITSTNCLLATKWKLKIKLQLFPPVFFFFFFFIVNNPFTELSLLH